jgi:glutathione-specific gamma-glutamylcyclotransferase
VGATWVFGYGSLIWNPGFRVAETRIARAHGWHRSFCMRSVHYRGTVDCPGLVLALDAAPGATCDGVAFRVQPGAEEETHAILRERELIASAYLEARIDLACQGETLTALAFVIDPHHDQYCGGLSLEEQAQIIAKCHGERGPNRDYLWSTSEHLTDLGIEDPDLTWLSARVREICG